MRTIEVANYAYDSTGKLRAVWDPRLDWVDSPPITRHLQTSYDYDSNGVLSSLTPPGQLPWQFDYTTVPGDSGAGRLASVSRSALAAGTAITTVVYRVPVTGTGAPYDLSGNQTARWSQIEPPTDAVAVFPPTQVPTLNQASGSLPASYEYAAVTYLDANGRIINTAAPGGAITSTWVDRFGNVVRELGAGNRARALDASPSDGPAEEAALAETLSDVSTYSGDGRRLLSTLGPEHDVVLDDGTLARGRAVTIYTYDQGAPAEGGPFNLVTTTASGVRYDTGGAVVDADLRSTVTDYDWSLRAPTVETIDPAGLALTTRTAYNSDGDVTSITTPAGGTATDTPSTRAITHYTSAANASVPQCGDHPEWDGLVCRTAPGGQPATGPALPTTVTTYDPYGQTRTATESTSTATLRTTTIGYDQAGRPFETGVVAPGLGEPVPKTRNVYDVATGQAVRTQSLDSTGAVTAEIVRGYDSLGRQVAYTDDDAKTSTTSYDIASRIATVFDGKATRTYTYDQGSERRGLPTQVVDSVAGTFTANYDTDGNPIAQAWPGGITVTMNVNEQGVPTSIAYTQPDCGQPDCTLFAETVAASAHGQWRQRSSTLSSQVYGYDNAGRLTTVQDMVDGQCTTRVYAFEGTTGKASSRTALISYDPDAASGACQTNTAAASRSYSYDSADRITTSGTVYDELGRTLTTPAEDTLLSANGDATMTYHANDMARSVTQNGRGATYTLDVITNRFRSWIDNGTGGPVTKVHHYANDGDSPTWTDEGGGSWTRSVGSISSLAGIDFGPSGGSIIWQIVDLRGDVVGGAVDGIYGLPYTAEVTEYGQPRNAADVGVRRYGYGGLALRASDTPSGVTIMGRRILNTRLGRFTQPDPVYGGGCNSYGLGCSDPLSASDPSGCATCRLTIFEWMNNIWRDWGRNIATYYGNWNGYRATAWRYSSWMNAMGVLDKQPWRFLNFWATSCRC